MKRHQLEIDERPNSADGKVGAKGLYFPDHVTHESKATMTMNRKRGQRLMQRAEMMMRQYPWVVLTMGAGLGYVASRRRRLS